MTVRDAKVLTRNDIVEDSQLKKAGYTKVIRTVYTTRDAKKWIGKLRIYK